MIEQNEKVLHLRTGLLNNYPTDDATVEGVPLINYGEIAINYVYNDESICIKNSNNKLTVFRPWNYISNEINIEFPISIVNKINKGEKYNTSTGEIEFVDDIHYFRTNKFTVLESFVANFYWNTVSSGEITVHSWNNNGVYLGSLTVSFNDIEKYEWSLKPYTDGLRDAVLAFDFRTTNITNSSEVIIEIVYDFATIKEVENKIETTTNTLNTSISTKSDKFKVQNITSSFSGSYTFQPNIYYVIDQKSDITTYTFSLATPSDNSIVNEYFIQFTTPSAGCALVVPSSIKWLNGETPIMQGGKTYQISIINNLAVVGVF